MFLVIKMTIIPCNLNCKHRKNGYCSLSACEIITNSSGFGCPYFIKKRANRSVGQVFGKAEQEQNPEIKSRL